MLTSMQTRIRQQIKRFDICSLLKLLMEIGYQEQDIYFQSFSELSSRPSLCEDIVFSEEHPRVTITMNLGLLSGNSPLPSLFRKKMDTGAIDPEKFGRFISFFDHHIIKNLVMLSMPETDNVFFSSWRETQECYLKMLDLNSVSTLWHLFQLCFPELITTVVKSPQYFKENSSSLTIGTTRLGVDCFLGKKIENFIPSYKFTFINDESLTDALVPWPIEVKRRLKELIYPLFKRTTIHFRVSLMTRNKTNAAVLSRHCHLGYSRIGDSPLPLKMLLFSGFASELSKLA